MNALPLTPKEASLLLKIVLRTRYRQSGSKSYPIILTRNERRNIVKQFERFWNGEINDEEELMRNCGFDEIPDHLQKFVALRRVPP